MVRLIWFELAKIWSRRGFRAAVAALLALNVFALWYTQDTGEPGLGALRQLRRDISGMDREQVHGYLTGLREDLEGVSLVEEIMLMRASGLGAEMAKQLAEENPGTFSKYYGLYSSGGYLRYTGSLGSELRFIRGLCDEEGQVRDYGRYLEGIRDSAAVLGGISVFGWGFAAKNIEKSAGDHGGLTADNVGWIPSAAVTAAGSVWTDTALILLSMLFVGSMTVGERQSGLTELTGRTRRGGLQAIAAKLAAITANCLGLEVLFMGADVIFTALAAGPWDLTVRLQSAAMYMESALNVSVLVYYILCTLWKGLALSAASALFAAMCLLAHRVTAPYFAAGGMWAAGWAMWRFIPAASRLSPVKYFNMFALLRAEDILGGYLNLDILGAPVSRAALSLVLTAAMGTAGAALCLVFYSRAPGLVPRRRRRERGDLRPGGSILAQEAYKLLWVERGAAVLAVFAALLSWQSLSVSYAPSSGELYYRDLMLELEGLLTPEKRQLIMSEQARYDEAFAKIAAIDNAVAANTLTTEAGEALKASQYSVTAFYPVFKRVIEQYEYVSEHGGGMVYDTGWLYLLGAQGRGELTDCLLVTLGIILAFANAGAVEISSGAWKIVRATTSGCGGLVRRKLAICAASGAALAAVSFLMRAVSVARGFPVTGPLTPARCVPLWRGLPWDVPLAALALGKLLIQASCGAALAAAVLGISFWRRSHIRALLCAVALLASPLMLAGLGFDLAGRLSLYPVWSYFFA